MLRKCFTHIQLTITTTTMSQPSRQYIPIIPPQEGILLPWLRSADHANMNLPAVVTLPLSIDGDRLTEAVRQVVGMRMALKMNFTRLPDGEVVMHPVSAPQVRHRQVKEEDIDREIREFIRPFHPFSSEPLSRFEVLTTHSHHYLLLDCHHSIADGYTLSAQLMQEDVPRAYAGEPLREETAGMKAASDYYLHSVQTEEYHQSKEYYRTLLTGREFTRLTTMPHDAWGRWHKASEYMDRQEIEEWCASHEVTPHQLFMAAWSLTLSRWSGEDEVLFFTLHHGRRRQWRYSYGMFVDSLPISARCPSEMTVRDLLHEMRTAMRTAMRHSAYPFTHLCRDLNMEPATTFAYQSDNVSEEINIDGKTVQSTQYHSSDSNSDVSCVVYVRHSEFEIRMEVSDKFLDAMQLRSLARSVVHVVRQLMSESDAPLSALSLTDTGEQRQIVAQGRGKRQDYDRHDTWVSMLLRQSVATPGHTAVTDSKGHITYMELNRHSAQVAELLLSTGRTTGNVVLAVERNSHLLVGMTAIMRSGMTMVPVDAESPEQHIKGIVSDCRAHTVLTTRSAVSTYHWHPEQWAADHVIYIDDPGEREADTSLDRSKPHGMAYILYTSGSTGRPKGVMISHSALCSFVHFIVSQWQLSADSRISCQASVAFDASLEDLLPVLTVGGSVVVADEQTRRDLPQLIDLLRRHGVTGGCYTPQVGLMLSEHHLPLRYLCLGGDRLNRMPQVNYRVMNTYGPTECTVDATWYEWDGASGTTPPCPVPIGRPLPAVDVYVVDPCGHLLPLGAAGELWIGGDQVAMGYWADESLTARRFTACPWGEGRVYHTGDRVRWNSDGQLEYIGRMDSQVKINGQRVEPGEVDSVLKNIDGIDEVHVGTTSVRGVTHLSAWYTAHTDVLTPDELRTRLLQLLPRHMVPTRWKRMAEMPHLLSGKIDTRHLPEPDTKCMRHATTPRNELERQLQSAVCEVLHTDEVSIDDDFFLSGGTSLTAMALTGACARQGIRLHYSTIFHHPTIRAMAEHIDREDHRQRVSIKPQRQARIAQVLAAQHHKHARTSPLSTCLITGASGFLGCHLLHTLLTSSSAHVICMVHAGSADEAVRKLNESMTYYFCRDWTRQHVTTERLTIVHGDVSSREDTMQMKGLGIDRVIHCAAMVKHFTPGREMYHTNVRGTCNIIDLCRETGATLLHISTVSVGGRMTLTEQQWYEGQTFHNDYEHSKFLAEGLVLDAICSGFRAMVIRVGNLTPGTNDGRWPAGTSRNGFMKVVDIIRHTGMIPRRCAEKEVDISPVDRVAADILSLAEEGIGRVVTQLSHYEHLTWTGYLSSHHKLTPRLVDDEEWERMMSTGNDGDWMTLIREYDQ